MAKNMVAVEDVTIESEDISQKLGTLNIAENIPLILCRRSNALVPSKINSCLYDFQRKGVQFLYQAFTKGTGAILNDVPNSGKKAQVVAFLSAVFSSRRAPPSPDETCRSNSNPALIICLREKICTWENRINKWSSLNYLICSELSSLSKAFNSVEVVLFPFDLLAKSVVNVAKREWKMCVVDDIDVIIPKPKTEILLQQLPRALRFGISSKQLNDCEDLATVVAWVHPKYYDLIKKDKTNVFLLIRNFTKKEGKLADQIRGLHLKAHLLNLRNEYFVKRTCEVPALISSQQREAIDIVTNCLPSTSTVKSAPSKIHRKRPNEKASSKTTAQSSKQKDPVKCPTDSDNSLLDGRKCNLSQGTSSDRKVSEESSNLETNIPEIDSIFPSQPKSSKPAPKSSQKKLEIKASCSSSSVTNSEGSTKDLSSSENAFASSQHFTELEKIDDLFFSSTKVLKSPQKSRRKAEPDLVPSEVNLDAEKASSISSKEGLKNDPFALLDSLFLQSPEVTKPAPSKFKSFTQAFQKTSSKDITTHVSSCSTSIGENGSSDEDKDVALSGGGSSRKRPASWLSEESKRTAGCSQALHEDLFDEILFTQPKTRRAPPKRKCFFQPDFDSDSAISVRQPMESIKNLDQDLVRRSETTSKRSKTS